MTSEAIALRALHGHAERFVALTRATEGGEVVDLGDALLTYAGPGIGPKSVFFAGPSPDHATAMREALEFFGERRTGFMVLARVGIDDGVEELVPRGELVATPSCMVLSPLTVPRPPDVSGLVVEELRGPGGMAEYLRVAALGFEEPPDDQLPYYPSGAASDPAFRFFVGSIDGEPVASAGMIRTPSGAGVYGVATIPSHRGHGIGSAMTAHVLAQSDDCALAFLQPTTMAVGMYERLGFEYAGGYRLFRCQP